MEPAAEDRLWTTDDYLQLPEDGRRHELQAGILIAEPQAFPRHGQIQAELTGILRDFVKPRRLGVVLTQVGFLLSRHPDTIRAPDVAFVRRDRFDANEATRTFFRGAPDLAIEILSPSNRPGEIHAKVADYLAAGSKLVWVIDPAHDLVSAYRSLLAPRRLESSDLLSGEDVLPGFSISVAALFER
jgi:Uma2 family endonuclease